MNNGHKTKKNTAYSEKNKARKLHKKHVKTCNTFSIGKTIRLFITRLQC